MRKIAALLLILIFASGAFAADTDTIIQSVSDFLFENGIGFSFFETQNVFKFQRKTNAKLGEIDYAIEVNDNSYTVYAGSWSSIRADAGNPKTMSAMSEFITRVNYGLTNGNFNMDYDDGEILYKVFVNCQDKLPSKKVIRQSLDVPAQMFKKYSPGMLSVMRSGENPKTALEKCEAD